MYKNQRILIPAKTEVDYFLKLPHNDQPLLIFLHGFGETFGHLLRHFKHKIPKDYGILAVNGIFPLPEKKFDSPEWKVRFCWYFYDSAKKEYFINQRYPAEVLSNLIKELNLEKYSKSIIGYSQGGYLAPFLGAEIQNVQTCIAVNAEYKTQLLPEKLNFSLINICGKDDDIVDPINCQNSHQIMISRGNNGVFEFVENCGHSINEQMAQTILKYC